MDLQGDLLPLLRCPICASAMRLNGTTNALACTGCGKAVSIEAGIPRFVDVPHDDAARRTQASFGYEWSTFDDWQASGATNFNDYFAGVDLPSLRTETVLDAGCGMGRHARQIAPFARRVVAVDFSRAIDKARENTIDMDNVACVQADLLALPLADGSFDFVYSLGVLHHLKDTEVALRNLVSKVRPGGRLRVYLYWKRAGWQGQLLRVVTMARTVSTKLPFGLLRAGCFVLSLGLYAGVVLPYRWLSRAGIKAHENWPLYVYAKYPFYVLFNDQFDRFSAPIEKRYDSDEVRLLLEAVGLRNVSVRPCFGWIADGVKS